MSIIYGPDTFTVASTQALETYNADWVPESVGRLQILAANDYLTSTPLLASATDYLWQGAGSPTGDQKIIATFELHTGYQIDGTAFWFLLTRGTTGMAGTTYLGTYSTNFDTVHFLVIERVIGGSATEIASLAVGALGVDTPRQAYFRAVTNGAQVDLTLSVAGLGTLSYSDTDAARILSGKVGMGLSATQGNNDGYLSLDGVSIDDFIGGEGGGGGSTGVPLDDGHAVFAIRAPFRVLRSAY